MKLFNTKTNLKTTTTLKIILKIKKIDNMCYRTWNLMSDIVVRPPFSVNNNNIAMHGTNNARTYDGWESLRNTCKNTIFKISLWSVGCYQWIIRTRALEGTKYCFYLEQCFCFKIVYFEFFFIVSNSVLEVLK